MSKRIGFLAGLVLALSVSAFAGPYDTWTNYRDVSINTTSGVISGTPTAAGARTITVQVRDANGATDTYSFTITVNEVNVAPVLTVPTNATLNELATYSGNATATDVDLPANTLTFALVSGPTGLTVSPSGAIAGLFASR